MKWEYKRVEWLKLMRFAHSEYEGNKALNELGDEEWELVIVSEGYAIFKRPKSEEDVTKETE